MSKDLSLQQRYEADPYVASRSLIARGSTAAMALVSGVATTAVSVLAVIVHMRRYGQYVQQLHQASFVCAQWHYAPCPVPAHALSQPWLFYLTTVVGITLAFVGWKQLDRFEELNQTARIAHDDHILNQHEAHVMELRGESFRLLHLRLGWWTDCGKTVLGAVIEYQPMQGGRRTRLTFPVHRVSCLLAQDGADNVFFPERESASDLGLAAVLMLAHVPWWLRGRRPKLI